MSWCTNPSQRSARWTTSLRAGLSPLCGTFLLLSNSLPVGPNSVTSAAHTRLDSVCLIQTQSLHWVGFRISHISTRKAKDQLTRTFLVVCVASAAFYILPPFLFFMGLGISQPAVVPSPTLFPLAHTLRFREALPTAGSHTAPPRRELFFSPLLLSHLPPYRQVNTPKLSPSPSVSLCLSVAAECHLRTNSFSQSIQAAWCWRISLMKDSKGAENCSSALLSASSATASLTTSLCKQPPPLPKALPVWHRVTPTMASLKSDFPSLTQSERRAEHGTQAGRQMLHLLFHSEYTQGTESRHAARQGHTSAADDWLAVGVTTSRQTQ